MLTDFGKELRRLRIDADERMMDMARRLQVSAAMMSLIETGKKPPPRGFEEAVIRSYELEGRTAEHLRKKADQSRRVFTLRPQSEAGKILAGQMSRCLDSLTETQMLKIQSILHQGGKVMTATEANMRVVLTSIGSDKRITRMDTPDTRWRVALAKGDADVSRDTLIINTPRIEDAVAIFLGKVREGYPGMIVSQNLQLLQNAPAGFCEQLTEEIWKAVKKIPEADRSDTDFDNMEFSALREAMIDAYPEYSGEVSSCEKNDPGAAPA